LERFGIEPEQFMSTAPRILTFTIVALLLGPWPAQARTINVPGDAATIQGGINAAVSGDTVLRSSQVS
jgi:hypothetical protein